MFYIVPRHVLGLGFTTPSNQIAVGFTRLGKQSAGLGNFKNEAHVMAVCSVYQPKVAAFTEAVNKHYADKGNVGTYAGCERSDDYRILLNNKGINTVVIATPTIGIA